MKNLYFPEIGDILAGIFSFLTFIIPERIKKMLKKYLILTIILSLAAFFPAASCAAGKAAKKAPAKPALDAPALSDPGSWSMVVVPDVQTYTRISRNHGILDMMNAWIVDNIDTLKIKQVLFTGDLVYYNCFGRVSKVTPLICKEQWKAFSRLMERLDGQVPYVLCTGNHDYGVTSAESRVTSYNEFFPSDRNPLTRRQLVECGPNTFNVRTMENAAFEFTAPYPDNRKFLIITLPFAPTDANLAWAKKIADAPRFADHFGIVLTHSYIYGNGQRIQKEKYLLNKKGGNPGEGIYQKLVYPAKNIRMVVCGHVCRPDNWEASVGFSMTKNSSGKTVAQMAFNTQAIGGGFTGNGGDGWLRLLEFMPDKKTIKAKTFSPLFAISPSTWHLAWRRDARNEFTFTLE